MNLERDFQQLAKRLQQWNGRRRLAEAMLWLPRGLLAGLLVAVVVATVARFRPLLTNDELAYLVLALALVGLLISLATLLIQRRPVEEQARFADRRFHLRERISTAVELQSGRLTTSPTLARQQLGDALRAANQVEVAKLLPLRLNWQDWTVLLVAVALLAAALYLPNPQAEILNQQRAIAATIESQIEALEALVEEVEQNPALTAEQKEELLEPLQGALQELQAGDLSREEAVAVLSEAEADLRALGANNSVESLRQRLQEAGQPLADNAASQALGQSLQSGDLTSAGAAAARLADNLPGLSPEEQSALARDLAQTAAALQNVDSELARQFAQAAEALQNGDVAAAQQALREAAATLQQRAQQQAAAQQAAAAADQLAQGRQEVAQAGQADQGQPGTGQETGEPGPGPGEGQVEGPGTGPGVEPGQQGGSGQLGQETGGPGPGGGPAENVYVPDFVDLSGVEGVEVELPAECIANPASCGPLLGQTPTEFGDERSLVPYNQVFIEYRDAAYEALSGDYVPLGLKGYIRDYFSSLEPRRDSRQ